MHKATVLLAGLTLILSACGQQRAPTASLPRAVAAQATCATTNLALNKPALASSSENPGYLGAAQAVDGNGATRWASLPSDPQTLQVNLGSVQQLCSVTLQWEAAYAKTFKIQVSNDGNTWTDASPVISGTGGTQVVPISASGQYVRLDGLTRATGYGYSLFEFQVFGAGGTTGGGTGGGSTSCTTTNAALNKPALASSTENPDYLAAKFAFDGDTTTRWASQASDPQSLQVNLGSRQQICGVTLQWEAAYGKAFEIQGSNDGTSWTKLYGTTTGTGGTQTLPITDTGTYQYVRLYGTARGTGYGYSLFEFQVFTGTGGTAGGGTTPPTTLPPTPPTTGPGVTKITGSQGNWQFTVDGQPYIVKGLTWGPPVSEAAARMPDLRQMGVNTVRTWGTDASSQALFDAAAANNIRVIAGFWLQPGGGPGSGGCVNYVTDSTYKSNMLTEFSKWVNQYKTNKGLLMWDVGNESILGMDKCFSGAELENQRAAYAKYVNDVARAIHAIDPNHPVTSTDAWTGAWPYLKANAPDLDLYAVNSYGSVCNVKQDWISGGYTKPYIVTEGGPAGDWEVPIDPILGKIEHTDVQKADAYVRSFNCVVGHTGVGLGETFFHYGTEGDYGGEWFNITTGNERRLSYYAIRKLFGGAPATNTPPVISNMTVSNATSVPAGSTFTLSASVNDPDGDPIAYSMGYNSNAINGATGIIAANFTGSGPWTVTAPQQLGVWKLYIYARDGHGNVGIETRSLRVVAPPVAGTNIALNRPTTALSYQAVGDGAPFPPQNATDGNTATRWSSDWSDPQWIQVDLGSVQSFNHVQLIWEAAYAKAYQIQVSDDGNTWRDVYSTITGDGGADDFDVSNASGRYVRMNGTVRGTGFGYALYEFGIYKR